jgi:hypothetical protein
MKLTYLVGINDAEYAVDRYEKIYGKRIHVWRCQFYNTWQNMLRRCYSTKFQSSRPTYAGCSVSKEWLTFSNFKLWMEDQDWNGKHLDKDILIAGNNVYSQYGCVFVDKLTNSFLVDSGASRGEFPIGVCFSKSNGKLVAQCGNPFTGKQEYLGYFADKESAHLAWRKRKYELALLLAERQSDARVAKALRERFKGE